MIALTPRKYFTVKWHVYDCTIVGLSLVELWFYTKKMSVLRSFRLVKKIARSCIIKNIKINFKKIKKLVENIQASQIMANS
jgi:hypothetical protein